MSKKKQRSERQARQISQCDGCTPKVCQEFIGEVESTILDTQRTIYVEAHSSDGAQRRELQEQQRSNYRPGMGRNSPSQASSWEQ